MAKKKLAVKCEAPPATTGNMRQEMPMMSKPKKPKVGIKSTKRGY